MTVLHHPEGSRVVDAVLATNETVRALVLVGLCGALVDLPVGTVVSASSAARWQPAGAPVPLDPLPGRTVHPVVQVDGFLVQDGTFPSDARARGAGVVDMETYWFALTGAAERPHASLAALLVVTDRPGREPFWAVSVPDADLERIAADLAPDIVRWSTSDPPAEPPDRGGRA
jgi:hypothetical protein